MIGLCVQRLRCQTARNIPAFPISSMVKSRRHLESVDKALEDLLEAEMEFEDVLKETVAEVDAKGESYLKGNAQS